MALQYPKKEVIDQVDFLHADKHQSFLQVDLNTLGMKVNGHDKYSQNTQRSKFAISLWNLNKTLGVEFIACIQINIKLSLTWY